jgi:hypothetical protein
MGRLTGHRLKKSGSLGEIKVVTKAMGRPAAVLSKSLVVPRRATPNNSSFRQRPSLIFAEDNSSESDELISRDRRVCSLGCSLGCSFVSSGSGSAEVMDLRMLDSEHGAGRSSYDLSVCSGSSFETMKTNDAAMEKMGKFEVALPSGLKRAVKKEKADHSSIDDEDKSMGSIIKALVARSRRVSKDRRLSMETIWSRPVPANSSPPTNSQDPSVDTSVTKKVLEDTKSTRDFRRCALVAAIFVFLSTFVASIIYFEMEVTNPSSLISSFATKTTGMLEGLFGLPDETEVQQEQVVDEPSVVLGRRRALVENTPRGGRVARSAPAKIESHEEKLRMVQEQAVQRNLRGVEDMVPQDPKKHRRVKLNTFVY